MRNMSSLVVFSLAWVGGREEREGGSEKEGGTEGGRREN